MGNSEGGSNRVKIDKTRSKQKRCNDDFICTKFKTYRH
jgi:hypothetical protein